LNAPAANRHQQPLLGIKMALSLYNLGGKIAMITGATRGIGRAMAVALAEAGADIVLIQVKISGLLPGFTTTT
jgi:hypothetical protein